MNNQSLETRQADIIVRFAEGRDKIRAHRLVEKIYREQGYIETFLDSIPSRTLIFLDRNNRIVGTTSIYDSKEGFPLSRFFNLPAQDYLPDGLSPEDVFEIGRTVKRTGRKGGSLFFLGLMKAIQEYSELTGAKSWMAFLKPYLIRLFIRHGWPTQYIEKPVCYENLGDVIHYFESQKEPPRAVITSCQGSTQAALHLLRKAGDKVKVEF